MSKFSRELQRGDRPNDQLPTGVRTGEIRKDGSCRHWIFSLSRRTETHAIVDQVIVSGASFLTGVVIGRFCSKEEFGLYMLGVSVIMVLVSCLFSLVTQPYTVLGPRLPSGSRATLVGSVVIHQLMLSLTVAVVLVTGAAMAQATLNGDRSLTKMITALALVLVPILFKEFVRGISFGNMDFRTAALVDGLAAIIQVATVAALAVSGVLTASRSFVVIGAGSAAAGLAWLLRSRQHIRVSRKAVSDDWRQIWAYGRWLFPSALIWNIGLNIYPWILAQFHGVEATGVYAACVGVVALVSPVTGAITNFSGPKIAHFFADFGPLLLRNLILKMMFKISIIMAPFCVFFLFAGGWFAVMIYGEKYSNLGLEVSIFALNIFVVAVSIPLSRALHTLERADLDFFINFVPLLVMLFFGVQLVAGAGVFGTALSLLIGNLAASLIRWMVLWRVTRPACAESGER